LNEVTIYEHPLNERIRSFLRLEHLLGSISYFLPDEAPSGTRAAVQLLVELSAVFARADLKTEVLKELERQTQKLARIGNQPGVDSHALKQVLDQIEGSAARVRGIEGPFAQKLRSDDFLKSIAQRSVMPGGTCPFDLPQYHHWLTQPASDRQGRLQQWLEEVHPVEESISLLLKLIRSSSHPRQEVAEAGFFQQALDTQASTQLVRVGVARQATLFPEISGGKHRISVRFLQAAGVERPVQMTTTIPFEIAYCAF